MTQEPGQIPLLMRSEDLATWDNWLSRPETAALEQLLRGQMPEHSAYVWGGAGMGKSHILQACCEAEGQDARYIPLRDLVDFTPEQVLADAEIARLIAIDDIDFVEFRAGWQEALFGLFNAARETGAQLLVTADKAPQQLLEALPDLRSRLSSLPVFQMPRFTEDQIAELLALRTLRWDALSVGVETALFLSLVRDMQMCGEAPSELLDTSLQLHPHRTL